MSSTVDAQVDAVVDAMSSCSQATCGRMRRDLAEALQVLGDLVASDLMDSGPCVLNDRGDCLEHLWSHTEYDGPRRACPDIRARLLLARYPLGGPPPDNVDSGTGTDRSVPRPRAAPATQP